MTGQGPGTVLTEALAAASRGWPVVPGVVVVGSRVCSLLGHGYSSPSGRPVPVTEVLRFASSDPETVRMYWRRCPQGLAAIATGGGIDALEMPAFLGERTLRRLRECGLPVPPVVATPDQWSFLVAPEPQQWVDDRIADLALWQDDVRYRGADGWVILPPAVLPRHATVSWIIPPHEVNRRTPTARQLLSNVAYVAHMSLTPAGVVLDAASY